MSIRNTLCLSTRSLLRPCQLFVVVAITAYLVTDRTLEAKPQIQIQCAQAGSGYANFSLDYSSTGNSSWDNWIYVDLYDSNGVEISSYPMEDSHSYQIPASQTSFPNVNTNPTGTESDSAAGSGGTCILSVSGEWNGASCPPCQVTLDAAIHACAFNGQGTKRVTVRHGDKRRVGTANIFDQYLEIVYAPSQASPPANLRFVYGLFKKSDPDTGTLVPLQEVDSNRVRHTFRRVRHTGSTKYLIAANAADTPYIVQDIRLDLTQYKDLLPTDYVYLDVFVVDLTDPATKDTWALRRVQILP